ncbi:hypothetical protein [Rhodanobacter sp. DHG33]|uniref:hypothetical protein n=1 Tax=Rhodanobacter sp. DHG33 TaxID=2775921 RepID=UPI00177C963B|nr:hypothetical protein [Rhodanobacter sp. DHG33]MBD8898348.1 hypothetical protein [Rhodanobacter sp. DHG33]
MRPTSSHPLLCLLLLMGIVLALPARADVTVAAKQVSLPGLRLQDMSAVISEDPAGGLHLHLQASQADVAAMGWRHVGLRLDGRLQRDAQLRWTFDGRVQLRGAPGGALGNAQMTWTVSPDANTMQVELRQDRAMASAWLPLDQPSHAEIKLRQLPVGWLQGVLGKLWSGRLIAGRVDADLALDAESADVQSSGQFTLDGLGFDKSDGTAAGQGVSGKGRFGFDSGGDASRVTLQGSLTGGELSLGALHAKLPEHPVQVDVNASSRQGALSLDRLRVDDADALQLDGALAFDAKGNLQKLQLDHFHASFPLAGQRYGQVWQAALGLRDARLAGRVNGRLDLRSDGLHAFAFDTDGLDLADGDGHFAVSGLRGSLDWAAQGNRPVTTLAWQGMQYYRIPVEAGQSHWQSRDGSLSLSQPAALPVLQGQVRLTDLEFHPEAAKGQRLAASLTVAGVDMASLTRALNWPVIPGTLSGTIPSVHWADDSLELGGGLSAGVFGGTVGISRLSLQQPFGEAPVLVASFKLDQLDLSAVTGVFDIGNITGKLHGFVDDLHLVDWSPTGFKASLLADGGGRISQRAVNNLAAIGGGGVASGLQGAMLKLFKTFSYKRIGLDGTLQDGICQLGGLSTGEEGFTIVEGSGLPHLQVLGHQAKLDWPTLQRRLREATSGHAAAPH